MNSQKSSSENLSISETIYLSLLRTYKDIDRLILLIALILLSLETDSLIPFVAITLGGILEIWVYLIKKSTNYIETIVIHEIKE